MFHINACSLNENFDDLEYLLKCTNKNRYVVAITETRITRNTSKLCNISLKNYTVESTPTKSSAKGIFLYIANHMSHKSCYNLNVYKKSELELPFVEIINPKKSNMIFGVIYRPPSMDVTYFNKNYLNGCKKKKMYFFLMISISIC